MKNLFLVLSIFLGNYYYANAQNQIQQTPSNIRQHSAREVLIRRNESILKNWPFVNIGPTVMGGRVVDLDVNPENPAIFYAALASGGLMRTSNNGQSFEALFQQQEVMSIGDIAVDWQNGETIWLGSGENNSSRSSYSGTGIYLSRDKGKSWQHAGLTETQHIGRIVIHPKEPATIFVAAMGNLYAPNAERGLYITRDGGKNWEKSLFVNENTGAIDVVIDPENPDIIYVALWHRARRAWQFTEAGDGSGIYKSVDAGKTWAKLNNGSNGFPNNEKLGRIGLALAKKDGNTVIYAVLDNQNFRPQIEMTKSAGLEKNDFENISKRKFNQIDDKDLENFLRYQDFPLKYTAQTVKEMVKKEEIKPVDLKYFLEDENSSLFETPIIGLEVYRSNDDGNTWLRTHADYMDDVFYTYGYYFGQIMISPGNPEHIYVLGVPVLFSADGGKNFRSINPNNVHADHHALWINPQNPDHLIIGNDGGINISYDNGNQWINANNFSAGQFYGIAVDMAEPYMVYGGLQDNGVWTGPSTYRHSPDWMMSGYYQWQNIMGGDGMQVALDWRNNETLYTGYQFGYYFRVNKNTGEEISIKPRHELGQRPFRFNWQTPIWLSQHNQDVIYLGSNFLHCSLNKGENMQIISPDLTNGGQKGNVSYGTLTSIHESPLRVGLLYTGSDDGAVFVSKDAGKNWENISAGLPIHFWVSRVWASVHSESRVYLSLNGYRWDNFSPLVFVSDDYGKNWLPISANLPIEAVNVIKEDLQNENILYVGTDHGLYVSFDRGLSYHTVGTSLPRVPVHDLCIHPREGDLLVATHGRSVFKASLSEIRALDLSGKSSKMQVFTPAKMKYSPDWGQSWSKWFDAETPVALIAFFVDAACDVETSILSPEGLLLNVLHINAEKGLNYLSYDLSINPGKVDLFNNELEKSEANKFLLRKSGKGVYYLVPGTYGIEIKSGETKLQTALIISQE